MPRVFISYVRENSDDVRRLVNALTEQGVEVWFDRTHLQPGDRWREVIRREIEQGDFFIACFSKEYSQRPKSFMNEEITQAIEQMRQLPTDRRWFIPVLLSSCSVPGLSISPGVTLHDFHWVALHDTWDDGIRRILDVIMPEVIKPTQPLEPEMILIPAGTFLMGSDPTRDQNAVDNERPQHTLYLADYSIAKAPVTHAEYAAFVEATNYNPPEYWMDGRPPPNKEKHPVVAVNWYDTVAYCRWLSNITGKSYCLPSEAEWEKAARGDDGRIYPWGDSWEASRCNTQRDGLGTTTPVDAYPIGASPYGVLDMAGNVREWTRSLWGQDAKQASFLYPYNPHDGREDLDAPGDMCRVQRGGSFFNIQRHVRCAYRLREEPLKSPYMYFGFRVAMLI